MKSVIAFILTGLLLCGLTACRKDNSSKPTTEPNSEQLEALRQLVEKEFNGTMENGVFTPADSFTKKVLAYDMYDKVLEEYSYHPNGSLIEKVLSDYDQEGWLTKKTTFQEDGSIRHYKTYHYDEVGRLSQQHVRNSGDQRMGSYYYRYDDQGTLLEEKYYTNRQKLVLAKVFEYQPDGKLLAEIQSNEKGFLNRLVYGYDAQGNIVQVQNLAEDGSLKWTDSYEYSFAGSPNWIEKKVFKDGVQVLLVQRSW